jgi:hypothetical protein
MMEKPPFKASNAAERQAMIDWVIMRLREEDELADEHHNRWDGTYAPGALLKSELDRAKGLARRGEPAPLGRLISEILDDPELAEFVGEPKRVRGQRKPYRGKTDDDGKNPFEILIEHLKFDLAWTVERIRRIWRHDFHRVKRHASDGATAEQIAGVYRDLITAADRDDRAIVSG